MRRSARASVELKSSAALFAALGDETRLRLVVALRELGPSSIARLTAGSKLTRQAVTKHLLVMQKTGLVQSTRLGRESRFRLEPERLLEARHQLDLISRQWDEALERLRHHVEG